jgi:hypothetical protein
MEVGYTRVAHVYVLKRYSSAKKCMLNICSSNYYALLARYNKVELLPGLSTRAAIACKPSGVTA